jgi:hypothetical protein
MRRQLHVVRRSGLQPVGFKLIADERRPTLRNVEAEKIARVYVAQAALFVQEIVILKQEMRDCLHDRPAADPRVKSLWSEFDIEIIPANVYPLPGQTRAPATIRRIIDKHGAEHARLVLCILAEGKGNHALIDETSLSAVSDLILACVHQGHALDARRDAELFGEVADLVSCPLATGSDPYRRSWTSRLP